MKALERMPRHDDVESEGKKKVGKKKGKGKSKE
jgi:hypothetical protein